MPSDWGASMCDDPLRDSGLRALRVERSLRRIYQDLLIKDGYGRDELSDMADEVVREIKSEPHGTPPPAREKK